MLADVEAAAREFADKRGSLAGLMEALKRSMDDTQRAMLPQIQAAAAEAAEAKAALETEIHAAADAFQRPKTRTLAGVKVGFQKGKDTLSWDDDASLVARIREHFTRREFASLVKVTEKPVDAALRQLPAGKLRILAVTVEDGKDKVVVRPADGGMDKQVDALLADAPRLQGGA